VSVWDALPESRAIEGLARQIAATEIAHAWLLLGPPGSGKRGAAVAMAAALNCEVAPRVGCGECSACSRIVRQRHPDVHHITPEGPIIPVDVVREVIIPEASRSPFEGHNKVFIIEEAERMNPAAQNALLKTLEEPQPDTTFVLVSDAEEDLLDTIRSRCRVVRLELVSERRIVELLVREGASEEAAVLGARLSQSDMERARPLAFDAASLDRRNHWMSIPARLASPLDALEMAAEILTAARDEVKERERAQKKEVEELAEALGEGRGTATARNALGKRHRRELRRLEEELLSEALQSVASFYRDVLSARSDAIEAVVNVDLTDEIETWAASPASDAGLLAAVERCVAARESLTKNANPLLTLEATLIDLVRLVPSATEGAPMPAS
jgi:DNA polymerase-3 subunit delta'